MKTLEKRRLYIQDLVQEYNQKLQEPNPLDQEDKAIDYLAEILVEAFLDFKKV